MSCWYDSCLNCRHPQQRFNTIGQHVDLAVFEAHLCHCWVQVVHDHQHNGGCLTRMARILINGVGSEETVERHNIIRNGAGEYLNGGH